MLLKCLSFLWIHFNMSFIEQTVKQLYSRSKYFESQIYFYVLYLTFPLYYWNFPRECHERKLRYAMFPIFKIIVCTFNLFGPI